MPTFLYRKHKIYYEYADEGKGPVVVFINGITQRTPHWLNFAAGLKKYGIRTITYDQLGQGASDKPVLDYDFEENTEILRALLDHCGVKKAYVAGISFGGAIVLKFALKYPERCAGLVPMSAFSQLDGRLMYQGICLYEGMVRVGFEYLIDLLIPMNFSSKLIESMEGNIPAIRRISANVNDLYSIQNLIESIRSMPKDGFTGELHKIECPTLILNGEYDYLTPRWAHEIIRKEVKNSRLMLIQHAYHAFTMEYPEVCIRVIGEFIESVENGEWKGDQSVWIAEEDVNAAKAAFPCIGDHTRSLPLIKPEELEKAAQALVKQNMEKAARPASKTVAPAAKIDAKSEKAAAAAATPAKTPATAPQPAAAAPTKAKKQPAAAKAKSQPTRAADKETQTAVKPAAKKPVQGPAKSNGSSAAGNGAKAAKPTAKSDIKGVAPSATAAAAAKAVGSNKTAKPAAKTPAQAKAAKSPAKAASGKSRAE